MRSSTILPYTLLPYTLYPMPSCTYQTIHRAGGVASTSAPYLSSAQYLSYPIPYTYRPERRPERRSHVTDRPRWSRRRAPAVDGVRRPLAHGTKSIVERIHRSGTVYACTCIYLYLYTCTYQTFHRAGGVALVSGGCTPPHKKKAPPIALPRCSGGGLSPLDRLPPL